MNRYLDRYIEALAQMYPHTAVHRDVLERFSPLLLCPDVVELPDSIAIQAQQIAAAFFELRQNQRYRDFVADLRRTKGLAPLQDPGHFSALSCLDFHVDSNGALRLIEFNTNASSGLIGDLHYRVQSVENRFCSDFREEIFATFKNESRLQNREFASVLICDERPSEQKLFLEFLLYQELFEQNGIRACIADRDETRFESGRLSVRDREIDLIYNRLTDFYLEQPESASIAAAWNAKAVTISPSPFEYMLLADKERMQNLTSLMVEDPKDGLRKKFGISAGAADCLASTLLATHDVHTFPSAELLWSERKKYFFKPKRSFGGKAVYRGSSVSRTVFENQIIKNDYVAQESIAPPTIELPTHENQPGGLYKYDLRFFIYKDRVQLALARLYQGQTTNSQTPGGGIAAIRWTDADKSDRLSLSQPRGMKS